MGMHLNDSNAPKAFLGKTQSTQLLINQALEIVASLGIPLDTLTARRIERMAMAFLAVCQVRSTDNWEHARSCSDGTSLKTRDIIDYVNEHFEEAISRGSYDDIRRKDLRLLTLAGLVQSSSPGTATNDSRRGYCLSDGILELVRSFSTASWPSKLEDYRASTPAFADTLHPKRTVVKVPITLPSGAVLEFSAGQHNVLQKKIIEEFLPRYGYGAEVLYVGDTANKAAHVEEYRLAQLNFFELKHDQLPDIVTFSEERNWLYLIEAVHSSGPIDPERHLLLKQLTHDVPLDIVYVTAFLTRRDFRKFVADIAWETEVWIAEEPDHIIHFDGDRFLGPY